MRLLSVGRSARLRALGLQVLVVGSLVAFAGEALAIPLYMENMLDALEARGETLECHANACYNCHQNPAGGGSFTQPFAIQNLPGAPSLLALSFHNATEANAAIAAVLNAGVDTDGDTVLDYDELVALTNPNPDASIPPAEVDCSNIPRYGCGAHIAPAEPAPVPRSVSLVALGVFLAAFGLRRRGRR